MKALLVLFFFGCGPAVGSPPSGAAPGLAQPFGVPTGWLSAMRAAGVVSDDRQTIHVSHTCDLVVEGQPIYVVDVRQILADMPAPRGFNFIVLLDGETRVVQALRYLHERPMRCDGNRLLLYDRLAFPSESAVAGNGVVVTDGGRTVELVDVPLTAAVLGAGR